MKRRQQTPTRVIGLRGIAELHASTGAPATGLTIGAGADAHRARARRARCRARCAGAVRRPRAQVATPHLRNMGTLGGNLCLDTRCNYYDQNYEWRKAIDFCMKKDGEICWVAPAARRCWAVSSTDTAPALMRARRRGHAGVRRRRAAHSRSPSSTATTASHYLTKRPDEILTAVHLPADDGLAQRLLEAAPARLVRLPGAVGRRRRAARATTARSRTRASSSAPSLAADRRRRRGRGARRPAARPTTSIAARRRRAPRSRPSRWTTPTSSSAGASA